MITYQKLRYISTTYTGYWKKQTWNKQVVKKFPFFSVTIAADNSLKSFSLKKKNKTKQNYDPDKSQNWSRPDQTTYLIPLRKHTYSNILKISLPKTESFHKNSGIFHISAQNKDCQYSLELPCWSGSNKYPQSMFWAEIWKIMYIPVNPSFTL